MANGFKPIYYEYITQVTNIFNFFLNILYKFNTEHIHINNFIDLHNLIIFLIIFSINNIIFLNRLILILKKIIYHYIKTKTIYLQKLNNIENNLTEINIKILNLYYNISNIDNENYIIPPMHLQNKNITYNDNLYKNYTNLDLYSLNTLDNDSNIDNLISPTISQQPIINLINLDDNYIDYKEVNIGYNNYYKLHCFKTLLSNLPFNLLMYINDLEQIVIKIGNEKSFKYINSKLYKIYNNKNNINKNIKSILCNNNIQELNKKCYSIDCKYYHDYIIGYPDNSHKDRQFSPNPIVYSCNNFRDGSKVKENINNVDWYDAINLYQSSLSNILIGCIHSIKK